jgi:hypothetical protein
VGLLGSLAISEESKQPILHVTDVLGQDIFRDFGNSRAKVMRLSQDANETRDGAAEISSLRPHNGYCDFGAASPLLVLGVVADELPEPVVCGLELIALVWRRWL